MLEVENVANVAFWARMSQSGAGKIEWVGSDLWVETCAHWPHTVPDFFSLRRWASRNADVWEHIDISFVAVRRLRR